MSSPIPGKNSISVLNMIGGGSRIVWQKGFAASYSKEEAYEPDGFLFSDIWCQPARRINKINQAIERPLCLFSWIGELPEDGALEGVIEAELTQFDIVMQLCQEYINEIIAIADFRGIALLKFYPVSEDRRFWKRIIERINKNIDRIDAYREYWRVIESGGMGSCPGTDRAYESPENRLRCGYYTLDVGVTHWQLTAYASGIDPRTVPCNALWMDVDASTWPGEPASDQWGLQKTGIDWLKPTAKFFWNYAAGNAIPRPIFPAEITHTVGSGMYGWSEGSQAWWEIGIKVGLGSGSGTTRTGNITYTLSRTDGVTATWKNLQDIFSFDLDNTVKFYGLGTYGPAASGDGIITINGSEIPLAPTPFPLDPDSNTFTATITEEMTYNQVAKSPGIDYYIPWKPAFPSPFPVALHFSCAAWFDPATPSDPIE